MENLREEPKSAVFLPWMTQVIEWKLLKKHILIKRKTNKKELQEKEPNNIEYSIYLTSNVTIKNYRQSTNHGFRNSPWTSLQTTRINQSSILN